MSKPLFDQFNTVSSKEWKQKIQVDLKGADYNDTLIWQTNTEVAVKPFYNEDDASQQAAIQHPNSWHICETIVVEDEVTANKKAIHAIEKGAESILFKIQNASVNLEKLTYGLNDKAQALHFETAFLDDDFAKDLNRLNLKNSFYHNDCIGQLAKTGNWHENLNDDFKALNAITKATSNLKSSLSVNISLYQNAGATIVQQLAYGIAHANEYLNTLEEAPKQIVFKIAVGTNYFFEIAKLRALRLLWNSLIKTYNIASECYIYAEPSKRNKTIYDYNTNMLRTTTECMSAVLGGANTICNSSYDAIYHKSNDFGERISRNQLLILKKESYFSTVSNAADGSYYIESLTQQLAEKALAVFKQIEEQGGFLKQLKEGVIQRKIKESANIEQEQFNTQGIVLLGTNKHPNPDDRMNDNLEINPFLEVNSRKTLIEPIIEKRLAEENEQNRLQTENITI